MEIENVAPLLGSNAIPGKATQIHCCNGTCDDLSTKNVPLSQGYCQGSKQGRIQRQSTSDSGFGSSLGPISEQHEDAEGACDKLGQEINANCCRSSPMQQAFCAGSCNCNEVMSRSGEVPDRQSSRFEETGLYANGTCRHSWKSPDVEIKKSCSSSCFLADPQAARGKCERRRTVSEGFAGSVSQQSNEMFQICKRGHAYLDNSKQMDVESASSEKKVGKCRQYVCNIAIIVMVLAILAGSVITIHFISRREMKRMEEEITSLKESIGKITQAPTSFAKMSNTRGEIRPGIHMLLKGERKISLDRWNQRVLQWIPHVGENQGITYNQETRSLMISESGIYFVYNQIYVFRHVSEQMATASKNQTIFHTIFKKPFNFPPHLEPMVVAESVLSNCWNENARSQIHTSYQGVIVKLQHKDQLFVGLEDYNESLDTLETKSTFFGAFKL